MLDLFFVDHGFDLFEVGCGLLVLVLSGKSSLLGLALLLLRRRLVDVSVIVERFFRWEVFIFWRGIDRRRGIDLIGGIGVIELTGGRITGCLEQLSPFSIAPLYVNKVLQLVLLRFFLARAAFLLSSIICLMAATFLSLAASLFAAIRSFSLSVRGRGIACVVVLLAFSAESILTTL